MPRRTIIYTLVVLIALLIPMVAYAGGGWSFGRGSMDAWGVESGLGNLENGTLILKGFATATAICVNPAGNIAPGKKPVNASGVVVKEVEVDENGRIVVTADSPMILHEEDLDFPTSPKAAGCPNNSWSVSGLDTSSVRWYQANIKLLDPDGNLVKGKDRWFDCTDDGVTLTCVQVEGPKPTGPNK